MNETKINLPEIILIKPQLPQNLGAVARAMLNFNFCKLRVVNPKFNLNNEKIIPLAAGADVVIKKMKVFSSYRNAIKDFNLLISTSNRDRSIEKMTISISELPQIIKNQANVGIIFGPENSGLDNEHLSFSDYILKIPANPSFSSINLSHAVLLVCYEIIQNVVLKKDLGTKNRIKNIASKKELLNFYKILELELENKNFFLVNERKKIIIQKIRNIFGKLVLNSSEIKILIGIVKALNKQ
mgnify:CR=1 FL=1